MRKRRNVSRSTSTPSFCLMNASNSATEHFLCAARNFATGPTCSRRSLDGACPLLCTRNRFQNSAGSYCCPLRTARPVVPTTAPMSVVLSPIPQWQSRYPTSRRSGATPWTNVRNVSAA